MNTDTVIHVRASHGVPFIVRLVRKGERYGLNRCMTHGEQKPSSEFDKPDSSPMVEFYDARYPMHGESGQFVSRYSVSTLLESGPNRGLLLDGGNPTGWSIDAQTMLLVRHWLAHHVPAEPGQAPRLASIWRDKHK